MSNYSHRRSLFGDFFLKTTAFEKAPTGRTYEFQKRHPNEEEGDDGDGNEEGNNFVGHGIISEASHGGGLTMGGGDSLN